MEPFHRLVEPREDVRSGAMDKSVYAASLSDLLVQSDAGRRYWNKDEFMNLTYRTDGLKTALEDIRRRLQEQAGSGFRQIETSFGGGKTHSMIAMYHMCKDWGATPVVIDGMDLDPSTQTIWGEIERQLDGHTAKMSGRVAPGGGKILELLDRKKPTLILIDEISHYLDGSKGVSAGAVNVGVGDSNKVTYISPKLGGFSVGMSYIPAYGEEGSNANPDISAVTHDGLAGAIAYSGSFGDVSIGGGVGMRTTQAMDGSGDNDDQSWAVSGKLGFGPLTVAAAYRQQTDPVPSRQDIVDAGVRYVQGSNSFSVTGVHSRADDSDAELTIVIASYARSLGAGVTLHTDLIWNDSQSGVGAVLDENDDPTGAMEQSEKSGTAFVTGIKVAF